MFIAFLLSGCSGAPTIKPSALPKTTVAFQTASTPRIGDTVEVNYFLSSELENKPYVVNVGDVLRVDVMDHPELSRDHLLVLPDGNISVPMVSRFPVNGKNLDELSKNLSEIYRGYNIVNPAVTVTVEQTDSDLDSLMRSISRNGQIEPFLVAVDESGMLDFPFIDPISANQPFNNIRQQIRAAYHQRFGDRLEVTTNLRRRQPPVVYVIGEVNKPGMVDYTQPLAPFMAVAAAGGFLKTAKRTDVRVLRYEKDGSLDQWSFDMDASMASGKPLPLELMPHDIIFVPKTGVAVANDVVEQYVRKMIPISVGFGFSYQLNQQN